MAKIYVTCRVFADEIDRLKKAGHAVVMRNEEGPIPRQELLSNVTDAEALICLLSDKIDEQVIEAAPQLQIIANLGVGYDNIDLTTASRHGIIVTNTPGALTETTADLTFGLLLSAARRIVEADEYVRSGEFLGWELLQKHLGCDVFGRTLGIVGLGRIGKAVARRGHFGFNMKILYHNRHKSSDAEQELNAQYASFEELLEASDFICVHTPLTDQTYHLFDQEAFRLMKNSAILVNVARGPVVDEQALVWALESGQISGAGIDVYEKEPKIHQGLIRLNERVVLSPHLGSATTQTRHALAEMAVDNVLSVLAGGKALNPVG